MTVAQFRRLALRLPGALEASHMDHPDFRVNGKIFATLGYPDARHGVVMITPAEQKRLTASDPEVFSPAPGKWGASGSTVIRLAKADRETVAAAIERAWKARAPKVQALHADTKRYNIAQAPADRAVCKALAAEIARALPEAENKIWHAHPVWFLDGNPIVGYSKLKDGVRLLFWSGQSFKTRGLTKGGKFKDASTRYTSVDQIDTTLLSRWLAEARDIQWDYKNIVKRKGRLARLK